MNDFRQLINLISGSLQETAYPIDSGTPASAGVAKDHYQVNSMGDNPMRDPLDTKAPEGELESTSTTDPNEVDKLRNSLLNIGYKKEELDAGDFKIGGQVAARLLNDICHEKTSPEAAVELLKSKLKSRIELTEFEVNTGKTNFKYQYVKDANGKIQVINNTDGTAVNLDDKQSAEFNAKLIGCGKNTKKEQDLMATYNNLMEGMADEYNAIFHSDLLHDLKPLRDDLKAMRQKMITMATKATEAKDSNAKMAAESFLGLINKFDRLLSDYLEKTLGE